MIQSFTLCSWHTQMLRVRLARSHSVCRKSLWAALPSLFLSASVTPGCAAMCPWSGNLELESVVGVLCPSLVLSEIPITAQLIVRFNEKLKLSLLLCPLRYIGKSDSITISVWNHKKIHKKQGAGFLGCVRLLSNTINRLKDTGCKCLCSAATFLFMSSNWLD